MHASLNTKSVFILSVAIVVLAAAALARSTGPLREWMLYRAAAQGDDAAVTQLAETLHREATDTHPVFGHLLEVVRGSQGELIPIYQDQLDHSLLLAAANGHGQTMQVLLDYGADLNASDAEGRGTLWWATINGHPRLAASLMDRGQVLSASEADSEYLRSTLIQAARQADSGGLLALLPFLNERILNEPFRGHLPLVEAAAAGHTATVALLLECGADAEQRDNSGQDALDAAGMNGHQETVSEIDRYQMARNPMTLNSKPDQEALTEEVPAP